MNVTTLARRHDMNRGLTYQLEAVLCGKLCRSCPHQAYWYAYWYVNGRTVKRYVGKAWRRLSHEEMRVASLPKKIILPKRKGSHVR